jgi:hypothetical protein
VTSFTRTVCLHKLTKQADASLTFDMCSNNKCACVAFGGGGRRFG